MADASEEFDFAAFIQSPMQMLGAAMSAADTARKSMTMMVDTVQSLQRSAAAFETLLGRLDALVDTVEAPARALAPEMDKFARRMREVSDALDGPIDSIVPGVQRMAAAFDRVSFEQLPDALEMLSTQIMGIVGGLGELPRRLGPLGDLLGGASGLFGIGKSSAVVSTPLPPPPPPRSTGARAKTAAHAKPSKKIAKSPAKPIAKRPAQKGTKTR